MKKRNLFALLLVLVLVCVNTFCLAERAGRVITIDLSSATDEELAEAASQIKAEQKSRMKTTIQVDPAEVTVNNGATVTVAATVADLPDGITAGALAWTSSDEAVATCKAGKIKGTGLGNTVITCTSVLSDGAEVSAEIPVKVLQPVQGVSFANNRIEVMAGDVFTPEIIFKPEDASNKNVTMESSDENVVRVLENGQLEAVYAGKAKVTVTSEDSGKNAKLDVTVTKKLGKYDDELTFQGLEWGSDYKAAYKKLAEAGLVKADNEPYAYNATDIRYWPENELLFTDWSSWSELPSAFRDRSLGAMQMYYEPLKKIGGYVPQSSSLYFLNGIREDGTVDPDQSELCGVYFYFDGKNDEHGEMFVDLLAKMEAQYGEFTKYLGKELTRKYYKDIYDVIKNSMEGARQYSYRELGRDLYLSPYAICTLHGKNNTGIMLMLDGNGDMTLFYGKTDTLDRIQELRKALEAMPGDKGDAGI